MGTPLVQDWALAHPPLRLKLMATAGRFPGATAGCCSSPCPCGCLALSPLSGLWSCAALAPGLEHHQGQPTGSPCHPPHSHQLRKLLCPGAKPSRHQQQPVLLSLKTQRKAKWERDRAGGCCGCWWVPGCWQWHPVQLPTQGLSCAKPQLCKADIERQSRALLGMIRIGGFGGGKLPDPSTQKGST